MNNHKLLCGEASTSSPARDARFAVVAIALLVLLLAWGHAVDSEQQEADAFFAGMEVGSMEMAQTVADAYRQGRVDAEAASDACSPSANLDRRAQRVALRDALCARGQQ